MIQQLNKRSPQAQDIIYKFTILFTYLTIYKSKQYKNYIYTDTKHLFQQYLSEMMT